MRCLRAQRPGLRHLVLGGLLLLGCSAPPDGPGVSVRLAAAPRSGSGCLGDGQGLPPTALVGQGGTLRLSVVRHAPDGTSRFICDAAARIPEQTPSLDLGAEDGARYDLLAEWFDPTGARAGQGLLPDLKVKGDGAQPLLLYRVGEWSCPPALLRAGRAFHSATLLPSGEVLLVGGMAALPEAGPATFQLLNSVEVYDPRGGRFLPVAEAEGVVPRARAFHHAAVLDRTGSTVRIFVYGGLTAPLRRPALDGAPGGPTQLRFTPIGTTQAAGAEILSYDMATRRITRRTLPESDFPRAAFGGAAAFPGGGLLRAGGALFPAGREVEGQRSRLEPISAVHWAVPPGDGASPPMGARLTAPLWLVAPSVTMLSEDDALVLGASRSLPEQPPQVRLSALRLRGLPGAVRLGVTPELQGPATVYHTAVQLAEVGRVKEVLVTGGFLMEPSGPIQARQPPPAAEAVRLYRIRFDTPEYAPLMPYGPANACGSAQEHYRPAGFEAATATLSGRRVLVSGGTPTAQLAGCQDCEPGDTGTIKLLCVLRQVSVYNQATGKLEPGPPLGLGRMGHRQTLLPDGNILVTGGLVRPGGDATPATPEAEVFVARPRRDGADDPDDPVAPLLAQQGLSRRGLELARPCKTL